MLEDLGRMFGVIVAGLLEGCKYVVHTALIDCWQDFSAVLEGFV